MLVSVIVLNPPLDLAVEDVGAPCWGYFFLFLERPTWNICRDVAIVTSLPSCYRYVALTFILS